MAAVTDAASRASHSFRQVRAADLLRRSSTICFRPIPAARRQECSPPGLAVRGRAMLTPAR